MHARARIHTLTEICNSIALPRQVVSWMSLNVTLYVRCLSRVFLITCIRYTHGDALYREVTFILFTDQDDILLHKQTGSGAHPAYSLHRGNAGRAWAKHPPPSNAELKNAWSYTSNRPTYFTACTRTTLRVNSCSTKCPMSLCHSMPGHTKKIHKKSKSTVPGQIQIPDCTRWRALHIPLQ
jgi:hypothetical protein